MEMETHVELRKLERERGEETQVMIGEGCRGRYRKDMGR